MKSFLAELKRRNVFKVGVAYAVVAWVILQFVDIVVGPLNLPEWFQKVTIVLLAIGFPIALLLSWAYEMTPQGLKKTKEVRKAKSITAQTGQSLNRLIAGALVLALAFIAYDKLLAPGGSPVREAEAGQASIAVLPFVNMSEDAANEYFADGLSEEILNVLAKVPNLKVAGRTSSFQFKGENQDLREIGSKLGVDHVLEGSVRKQGNRVRITAQLVRTQDGFHLWSETYDRNLEDIFAVQDEISGAILKELSVTLSFGGQEDVRAPTTNMAAYDRYLEARVLVSRRGKDNLERAENLLLEATQIDPNYAEAWALLANVLNLRPAYDRDLSTVAFSQKGVRAAERAIELNPTIGLAYTGLGSGYSNLGEYSKAHQAFEKGWEFNRNDAEGNSQFGQFLALVGKIEQGLPYNRRAHELDPLSELYALVLGLQLYSLGQDEEAKAMFNMANSPALQGLKGVFQIYSSLLVGDTRQALEFAKRNVTAQKRELLPGLFESLLQVHDDPMAVRARLRDFWKTYKDASPDVRGPVFWTFLIAFKEYDLAIEAIRADGDIEENRFAPSTVFTLNERDFLNYEPFRALVREYGLVAYWREYGFPPQCRAKGENDYECD
jgi:TolB-like protein/tetratricopeptide (TPR) repeat protein